MSDHLKLSDFERKARIKVPFFAVLDGDDSRTVQVNTVLDRTAVIDLDGERVLVNQQRLEIWPGTLSIAETLRRPWTTMPPREVTS